MKAPRSILVYRLGFLGDIVVSLPCFHFIRNCFQGSRITLLSDEPPSDKAAPPWAILKDSGLCDDFIAYPVGLRDMVRLGALRSKIAKCRFDLAVNLQAARGLLKSFRDEAFLRSCGIKWVVGTPWRARDLVPQTISEGFYEPECERVARRLRSLGSPSVASRTSWALNLTPQEKQAGEDLLIDIGADFVTISVGTKLPAKDWGEEKWGALIRQFGHALPGMGLVLLGATSEIERSEMLKQFWPGPALNLCGRTSPRVAAAVLERSRLFIGHDSGPMHLAAASGTATLGLFSWNNPPGQWFPGHRSWKSMRALYPPLPAGGWHPMLKERRGAAEGINLIESADVCAAALNLWESSGELHGVRGIQRPMPTESGSADV